MEDFIEAFEQKFKVLAKEIFYIIDDLKREEFLASPKLAQMNAF